MGELNKTSLHAFKKGKLVPVCVYVYAGGGGVWECGEENPRAPTLVYDKPLDCFWVCTVLCQQTLSTHLAPNCSVTPSQSCNILYSLDYTQQASKNHIMSTCTLLCYSTAHFYSEYGIADASLMIVHTSYKCIREFKSPSYFVYFSVHVVCVYLTHSNVTPHTRTLGLSCYGLQRAVVWLMRLQRCFVSTTCKTISIYYSGMLFKIHLPGKSVSRWAWISRPLISIIWAMVIANRAIRAQRNTLQQMIRNCLYTHNDMSVLICQGLHVQCNNNTVEPQYSGHSVRQSPHYYSQ